MGVGRGQHKLEVSRRLFQRFQHGIESRVGQHVNLVNHEDLETTHNGFVNRLLQQLRDLVNAAIRGRIELGVVDEMAAVDVGASLANTARRGRDITRAVRTCAVERLGQNPRHRGLAHTAGAGEQIRMMQALRAQGVAQSLHHMRLPDHFRKILGAVFTSKD